MKKSLPVAPVFLLLTVYALVELALWSPPRVQWIWGLLSASVIVTGSACHRRNAAEMGFRRAGFRRSAWIVAAAILIAAALVLLSAAMQWLHPLATPHQPVWHAFFYAAWALAQEFILNSFFLLLLLEFLPPAVAIAIAALMFSAAHLPNLVLVPVALCAGVVSTHLFLRYRNLYSLAIAHAILGLALAVSLPDPWIHQMRVGNAFYRTSRPHQSQLLGWNPPTRPIPVARD
jgi:membrane protease YdiL (CAAX protease family)